MSAPTVVVSGVFVAIVSLAGNGSKTVSSPLLRLAGMLLVPFSAPKPSELKAERKSSP